MGKVTRKQRKVDIPNKALGLNTTRAQRMVNAMEVISLIENTGLLNRRDLRSEHGLSLFIGSKDQQILFDTGVSGNFNLNAQKLEVNTANVTLAVISHHHFDHGGGLATFLEANQKAKVYLRKSSTEQFYLDIFGLLRRRIGLDETLFQLHSQRFVHVNQFSEIAPDVFILTKINKRHTMPKGNRHLFIGTGLSKRPDDFEHELILVIRQNTGLVVFTGCSHHGILNMLDAVLEHFPGQTIKAVFGGFHLIDLPLINSMAGNKNDVEELGKAILKYPIEKVYTGHCTGIKAYRILKEVMGAKLEYFATGARAEV
jgi:7,8-dihydropterin-6-yl-methyl-4-(beta-D-ribofuranosyl)aminobenzene 5'-phosphate synthase